MVPTSSVNLLATIGLILSLYALYVESKIHDEDLEEDFVALCDIEAIGASCSTVFAMPEGKLLSYFGLVPSSHILDVPNAMLGTIYYTLCIIRENFLYNEFPVTAKDVDVGRKRVRIDQMILLIASGAMSASVFLAFRLTQLKELCVLCW
eukprot:CAMPEP_0196803010 /NCGR_PEP_ID=MMETSP1362-20130617/2478_1 /TAXON_ID=163516 /ORGANISM="Leptocylindrus danicus, Strain CCMP1856" /LENGTH=149 /DNA_ID=CAMNT_0042174431 /DNA_START=33 /DNA_END=479 /DNA_ORIENTATION=+